MNVTIVDAGGHQGAAKDEFLMLIQKCVYVVLDAHHAENIPTILFVTGSRAKFFKNKCF